MADVNSNKNQAYTGGPSVQSTGEVAQTNQPDSQRGAGANATGDKDYVEKNNPDAPRAGGKQPTDPVQSMEPIGAYEEEYSSLAYRTKKGPAFVRALFLCGERLGDQCACFRDAVERDEAAHARALFGPEQRLV